MSFVAMMLNLPGRRRHAKFVNSLEHGWEIRLRTSDDVLAAASVMKLWLRSLPEQEKILTELNVDNLIEDGLDVDQPVTGPGAQV